MLYLYRKQAINCITCIKCITFVHTMFADNNCVVLKLEPCQNSHSLRKEIYLNKSLISLFSCIPHFQMLETMWNSGRQCMIQPSHRMSSYQAPITSYKVWTGWWCCAVSALTKWSRQFKTSLSTILDSRTSSPQPLTFLARLQIPTVVHHLYLCCPLVLIPWRPYWSLLKTEVLVRPRMRYRLFPSDKARCVLTKKRNTFNVRNQIWVVN